MIKHSERDERLAKRVRARKSSRLDAGKDVKTLEGAGDGDFVVSWSELRAMGRDKLELPSETRLGFVLSAPLTIE